jgi:hypothetical protein
MVRRRRYGVVRHFAVYWALGRSGKTWVVCLSHVRVILPVNEYFMKTGILRHKKDAFWAVVRSAVLCVVCIPVFFSDSVRGQIPDKSPLQAAVVEGREGWLFLGSELRFLGIENFWGGTGRAFGKNKGPGPSSAGEGGPLAAIVDFDRQLKSAGVRLLLMPVPPKAWGLRQAPSGDWAGVKADSLGGFYRELTALGVEVLDLRPAFATHEALGEAMYCKTDSHWSGRGCVVAAQMLAERLRNVLPVPAASFAQAWKEVSITGDLNELSQRKDGGMESLLLRQITDGRGNALSSDASSPVLLLGDSHTLVFRDFQGERAGLADQLAFETGTVPEVIGTRGSGANAVRLSLLRRSVKDPRYIGAKKVVVWCFAAREFTESDQPWQLIPLSRPEAKPK